MAPYPESPQEEIARLRAEVKRLQERLLHPVQLETVGRLAGGIAHDFNNQLATILTYADMLKQRADDPKMALCADRIAAAVARSSELTGRLLDFVRKAEARSVPVDLRSLVGEVAWLMGRSVDKRIRVSERFEVGLPTVVGDPAQIQNALLNLGINAREAMPQGGEMAFSARPVRLESKRAGLPSGDLAPGEYAEVAVSDTGVGMDPGTQQRIFEPFFTTKPPGVGTGIGLAAVLYAAESHLGGVEVESEPGKGTVVRFYLPAAPQPGMKAKPAPEAAPVPGTARLLFVDDEEPLRETTAELLRGLGYAVSTCGDGAEAVERYRESWQKVDLVVLDMLMPEMNGADAFRAMRQINPKVKALLTTGRSTDAEARALEREGVLVVQKPCGIADLSQALAEALRGV